MGIKSTLEVFVVTFIGIFMLAALFSAISRDTGINLEIIVGGDITEGPAGSYAEGWTLVDGVWQEPSNPTEPYATPGEPPTPDITEGPAGSYAEGWTLVDGVWQPPHNEPPPEAEPKEPPERCRCIWFHCSSVCANAGTLCIISWTCKYSTSSATTSTTTSSSTTTTTTTIPTQPQLGPSPSSETPSVISPSTTTTTLEQCKCKYYHCSAGCGILAGQYCAYDSHCFVISQ